PRRRWRGHARCVGAAKRLGAGAVSGGGPPVLQFLALTLAGTSGALAQPAPDAPAPPHERALEIPHERYELPNGLDVVLAPDTSTPVAHVQVWYHVGSKDEPPGRTGFAHLFEHLMFQGSLNAPGDYFAPLQEIGADLNGTTNSDRTNYFETVPSRY